MVDINPWGGNYTGTVVQNNTIIGGFATSQDDDGDNKGNNNQTAIMKSVPSLGTRFAFRSSSSDVYLIYSWSESALQLVRELGLGIIISIISASAGLF